MSIDPIGSERAKDLLGLGLDLLFLAAADVRNDVSEDVPRRHAGIASTRDRLKSGDDRRLQAELPQWRQRHRQHHRRAVGIGEDTTLPGLCAALALEQLQMVGVHFRDQQRNGVHHSIVPRVADDDVARLGESRFDLARHRRIEA